jgi:signal transduction histidine kinase
MAQSFRLVRHFSLASLIAVLIVAFALAAFHAWKAQQALLEQGEQKNAAQVRLLLNQLDASERAVLDRLLARGGPPAADAPEVQRIQQIFERSVSGTTIVKLKLYSRRGLTVYSSELRQIGEDKATYPGFLAALEGNAASQLSERESFESLRGTLREIAVIGSYLPVRSAGGIAGVIEVYDDVTDLLRTIRDTRWQVFGLSAVLLSALYIALLLIVRRADRIVRENARELEREAAHRARVAAEAKQAQAATEKAQRETEKAYATAMAARRAAEEASQAKTEFLGRLSEEMRTPLNGVIGTTDVLLTGELSVAQRGNLLAVRAGATSLLKLLDDLLETARPESEAREARWEPLAPLAIAREAIALHAPFARSKGVALDCRATADVPAWVLGDARRLRLALTELVGIAARAGEGRTIQLGIDRAAGMPGIGLRFSVRFDAPRGLLESAAAPPPPANGGNAARDHPAGGESLDLHVARRLAEQLGGRVDVEAAGGQALALRLSVPLRPAGLAADAEEGRPGAGPAALTAAAP